MSSFFIIKNKPTKTKKIQQAVQQKKKVKLSVEATEAVRYCRNYLEERLQEPGATFYGINTGFGSLCNTVVSPEQQEELQHRLVRSHACGVGEEVPAEIVRYMLLLKIQSLAFGHSGVRLSLLERLVFFYNSDLLPVIPSQGSLGASGDLAPLAHLSLALLGEGEVLLGGKRMHAHKAHQKLGIAPLTLKAKEGLALLNGTQYMLAWGLWLLAEAKHWASWAQPIAALSLEAFRGRTEPFWPHSHRIRRQKGQAKVAASVLQWLEGSLLQKEKPISVQDPYAFRCVPQVHGASWDALKYVKKVFTRELHSVTDNPNIFPEENEILSAGNFHGQPLALAFDFLGIALSEFGSISERRTYQLISGQRGLPAFLSPNPGLNSGLMISQYTAASLASQNKQLATPASIDSIVSSNGQEDHVSMGANAALKTVKIMENLKYLLSIELLTAAQAMHLRRPSKTSPALEAVLEAYREHVAPLDEDRYLKPDIEAAHTFLEKSVAKTFLK